MISIETHDTLYSPDKKEVPVEVRIPNGRCFWCQRKLYKTFVLNGNLHVRVVKYSDCLTKDHVIPRSLGGKKKVRCCFRCNHEKGAMTSEEWVKVPKPWAKDQSRLPHLAVPDDPDSERFAP
jgi:5-methylcytosine-specific restriction endonuclease McrA